MNFEEEDPLNICLGFDANSAEFPYAEVSTLRRRRNELFTKKKALLMDRANVEELVAENDFLQMSLFDHLFRVKALSIQMEFNSTSSAKPTNLTTQKHALSSARYLSVSPTAKCRRTTRSVLTLNRGSNDEAEILPNQSPTQVSQVLARAELCSLPKSISGKVVGKLIVAREKLNHPHFPKPGAGGLLFCKTYVKTFLAKPFALYHVLSPADEANHDTDQRLQYFGLYSLKVMTNEDFNNFSQSVQSDITQYLVEESGKDKDGLKKVLSGKTKPPVIVMKFIDVKGYGTPSSM